MRQLSKKPTEQKETIWEAEKRQKREASELSEKFKDIKPVKFLLKN